MRQNTFQSYNANVVSVYMKAIQINMIFARKEVCQGASVDSDHIIMRQSESGDWTWQYLKFCLLNGVARGHP